MISAQASFLLKSIIQFFKYLQCIYDKVAKNRQTFFYTTEKEIQVSFLQPERKKPPWHGPVAYTLSSGNYTNNFQQLLFL